MTDQHNRTSDLNLGSSGGVVVHQGDNLRSLEMGSDGNMDGDSFGVSLNLNKTVTFEVCLFDGYRWALKLAQRPHRTERALKGQ